MKCFDQPLVLVDLETTGLSPVGCRIIEIACIRIEKGVETDRFVSLVDPEQPIPRVISSLTGIGSAHVEDAPTFIQIADRIEAICEGAVFVAHNAQFDYSFIRAEMERLGRSFRKKTLCTVKLSRALFPDEPRHDLSSIIARLDLTCENRHRALGDTEVLVSLLEYLEEKFSSTAILEVIGNLLKKPALPPQLDPAIVAAIPDTPGVYTFFDKAGAILYIGKSKHLRSRVKSHFTSTHREGKEMRIFREVAAIEYTETVSDLGASLLELYKIKNEMPMLNRMSRRTSGLWVLKKMRKNEESSYAEFVLEKVSTLSPKNFPAIYGIFRTKAQAKSALEALCADYGFCPKLIGLEKKERKSAACFSSQIEKCSGACIQKTPVKKYNALTEQVFAARKIADWAGEKPKILKFAAGGKAEVFTIDQWILKSALVFEEDDSRNLFPLDEEETFFDYDIYKVLLPHLLPRFAEAS